MGVANPFGSFGRGLVFVDNPVIWFTRTRTFDADDFGGKPGGQEQQHSGSGQGPTPPEQSKGHHQQRPSEPANCEPHCLHRQRLGSFALKPLHERRGNRDEPGEASSECSDREREDEVPLRLDLRHPEEPDEDDGGSEAKDLLRAKLADGEPNTGPENGGTDSGSRERCGEQGDRPAKVAPQLHGDVAEPLDPQHRLERPDASAGSNDFPTGVCRGTAGVGLLTNRGHRPTLTAQQNHDPPPANASGGSISFC